MKRMQNTNKVYKNIRRFYLSDLIFPILFILILAAAWKYNPFQGIYTPMQIDSVQTLKNAYSSDNRYVKISLKDLHNTGYDYIRFGKIYGTYYYTFLDDTCLIVILSPNTVQDLTAPITELNIRAKIVRPNQSHKELLEHLAEDLCWTYQDLSLVVSPLILDEADYHLPFPSILTLFLLLGFLSASAVLITDLAYLISPRLAPVSRRLSRLCKDKNALARAVQELETEPLLATGQMYVTEHYFFDLSNRGTIILPIHHMLWVYRHLKVHKPLLRKSMSYHLYLITEDGHVTTSPKRSQHDTDAVIAYLQNLNSRILIGFTEENKEAAHTAVQANTEKKNTQPLI
ncbi:DUF6709 family protein [Diplocloster modestus]|uniref:Uncharacterized protein n=1 Tax=Diplocloster modestus TaxID=2850322 RepID=A0ABS6KDU7_9FIRM|nr:DUF6709 family protein [Diplocloster modestus]MBU9728663.1 hypothetical protein [Diplocloster modestus]